MGEAIFGSELYDIGDILSIERGACTQGDPWGLCAVIESEAGYGHGVLLSCIRGSPRLSLHYTFRGLVGHGPDGFERLVSPRQNYFGSGIMHDALMGIVKTNGLQSVSTTPGRCSPLITIIIRCQIQLHV